VEGETEAPGEETQAPDAEVFSPRIAVTAPEEEVVIENAEEAVIEEVAEEAAIEETPVEAAIEEAPVETPVEAAIEEAPVETAEDHPLEAPAVSVEVPAVSVEAPAVPYVTYVDVPAKSDAEVAPTDDLSGAPTGTATVDFVILPEHYGQTKNLDIQLKIKDIRKMLEKELTIPEGSLSLMNMTGAAVVPGNVDVETRLFQFNIKDGDTIGLELRINYYEEQETEQYIMPDVLELVIHDGKEKKVVPVYIERPTGRKSYLGGFRNKRSNVEYHHAITQTPIPPKKEDEVVRNHRTTQTVEEQNRSSQCPRHAGTQMEKPGVYLSKSDVIIQANDSYFSSADLHAMKLERAVIIQCHVRGMFARSRARQLRRDREISLRNKQEQVDRDKLQEELRHKREIERRIHPRTYRDFEILRAELEAWRINETDRIQSSNFDQEVKQVALRQLLHKETKLLQTIDKLRNQARHLNKDQKVQNRLEAMSAPKVWAQSDLETTSVQTPFTTRAKELKDLYNGLRVPLLSVDERLDVLLHVKWTAKEFDCNLTREIVDLVDREADMLNRGRPENSFKGLRRRLANLFLQFVDTPEFNPEARRFQKVARDLYQQTSVQPLSTVPIGR